MLHTKSAKELTSLFKKGELSAEKIVDHFLARIEKYEPLLRAFLSIYEEEARTQAKAIDKKRAEGAPLGKLAGIPVALKDNMHIKGKHTTCGSRFLRDYIAPYDASVAKFLQREDAIIIGKTNLDEFAMGSSTENSAYQKTANPWHLDCVPGGSSGGSAAAVAARLVPLALGSDTGGSIRQPAAFCGVSGFKPSYGRVSRYGLVAFGSSLDQIGPFANSVEDIALLMSAIGVHDKNDATSFTQHTEDFLPLSTSIKGKKIGIPWNFLSDLKGESYENFIRSSELLKELGFELVEVDLSLLKYSIATYYIIATAEASTNLARFDGVQFGVRSPEAKTLKEVYTLSKDEGFGPEVKKRILLGTYVLSAGYQSAFYKQATKVRAKIIDAFNLAFETCDAIAMPTSPSVCFPFGAILNPLEMYLQDIYTIGANLARLPALSLPSGFNKEGKPLGLQIIGAVKEDPLVCRIGFEFEKATSYGKQLPPRFIE